MWTARYKREQDKCPQCSHPREECRNPEHRWFPQMIVCHATMERAAAQRRWDALHEDASWHDGTHRSWARERSRSHPYHRSDGVQIVVSGTDFGLGGDFLQLSQREDGQEEQQDAEARHERDGDDR